MTIPASTTQCTCPKRTENDVVVCCGRDVFCPIHGSMSRELVKCPQCDGKGSIPKEPK